MLSHPRFHFVARAVGCPLVACFKNKNIIFLGRGKFADVGTDIGGHLRGFYKPQALTGTDAGVKPVKIVAMTSSFSSGSARSTYTHKILIFAVLEVLFQWYQRNNICRNYRCFICKRIVNSRPMVAVPNSAHKRMKSGRIYVNSFTRIVCKTSPKPCNRKCGNEICER